MQGVHWHCVYVSSLFTWELQRTVRTIKFYLNSAADPAHVYVGGIGSTLMPDFIRNQTACTVVTGPLDKPGMLGEGLTGNSHTHARL